MEKKLDLGEIGKVVAMGDALFAGKGPVNEALVKITRRLAAESIGYALIGGLALIRHGFRRYTEDIDLLVTRESLEKIHERLVGLGYRPVAASKAIRDPEHNVRIDLVATGDFPGDGKPKPVAFPDPSAVSDEIDGIKVIRLAPLLELKLASGMSSVSRLRDLADAQDLIRWGKLDERFAEKLHPWVREKYLELWRGVAGSAEENA